MKALFLLPVLAFALTGCGTTGVSYDRVSTIPLNWKEMQAQPACSLRVCLQQERYSGFKGRVQNSHINNLRPFFASVQLTERPSPELCDVVFNHDSPLIDYGNLSSAYDGKFLARFTVPNMALGGAICNLFAPGTPGYARIATADELARHASATPETTPESRRMTMRGYVEPAAAPRKGGFGLLGGGAAPGPAPAPAAAPAQGLSADDIQRIAQAVRGSEPAAAPAAPNFSPNYTSAERPDDLAVIVGIESYSEIATKAPYAERDADSFKAAVRALGVPERNITLLKGPKAGKAALEKNLGTWLARLAKPESRVYVYFSGHGAPDVKTGQAYLVPWDGDPNFLAETAYPVAKLYKDLGALPAKQVLVALDSCFSGAGGRSVLASGARPLVSKIDTGAVPAKLTVLSASAGTEISGSLDDRQHGAFTWFLLEGLNAGKTTPAALVAYLTPRVQDEAKRLNRDQTPQLLGDGVWSLR